MSIGQDTGNSDGRGGGCDEVMRASSDAERRAGGSDGPGMGVSHSKVSTCTICDRDSNC